MVGHSTPMSHPHSYLYVKQDVLDADHVLQMFWREALHFDHFVVAGAVIEEVGALSEVRHHLKWNRNRCSLRSLAIIYVSSSDMFETHTFSGWRCGIHAESCHETERGFFMMLSCSDILAVEKLYARKMI